uniref:Uncharacterized protein n=1 Tax=Arundo donax TaxID=35708 RepID=A0A0A9AQF2_ARUDO
MKVVQQIVFCSGGPKCGHIDNEKGQRFEQKRRVGVVAPQDQDLCATVLLYLCFQIWIGSILLCMDIKSLKTIT